MKIVLLIVAFFFAFLCTKAQSVDSLRVKYDKYIIKCSMPETTLLFRSVDSLIQPQVGELWKSGEFYYLVDRDRRVIKLKEVDK